MKRLLTVAAWLIILGVGLAGGFFGRGWLKPATTTDEKIIREVLDEETAITRVVEAVTPSVVSIRVKRSQAVIDPFQLFFGRGLQAEELKQDIGSGFIIDTDGLVVTNKHVVAETGEYQVITTKDEELKVEKIFRDPVNDLAILKVTPPPAGLQAVKLGDSDKLKVGQTVVAIGTALGEFRSTVTTGVISGLGRGITAGGPFGLGSERLDNVIQTDAAINPGNSGGPLLNSSGEVIGVNVAVSQAGQNIGFALPINEVRAAIDNFNQTGRFSRPFLGVRYQMIDQKTAILNAVPQGAYIVEVVPKSPAAAAGISEGDIITRMNGRQLNEANSLAEAIAKKKLGDQIELELYRDGETKKLSVVLTEAGE
jgi:S1-C subfamily serine protease